MLIFIHGFNSSSQSGKARDLAAWMASRGLAEACACPDLPDRPAAAIALLEDLIARSVGPAKLIGSSLGGIYATWLAEKHNLKAVLVNPCVACHEKLADQVDSVQKNWHSGAEYVFSSDHLAELRALAIRPLAACRTLGSDSENRPRRGQFSTISPGNSRTIAQEMGEKWTGAVGLQPEIPKSDRLLDMARYLLLLETGDEVLDYREAVAAFPGARQVVLEGGDHSFTRFTDYLPDILAF